MALIAAKGGEGMGEIAALLLPHIEGWPTEAYGQGDSDLDVLRGQEGTEDEEEMAVAEGEAMRVMEEEMLQGMDQISIASEENVTDGTGYMAERPVVELAIVGRPNVGKSSLVNALLNSERVRAKQLEGSSCSHASTNHVPAPLNILFNTRRWWSGRLQA